MSSRSTLSNGQAQAIYYQVNGGGWQTYTGPFSLDGSGQRQRVL